jgi:uncharacterized protein YjeT (DUF2065 family)
VLDRSKLPPDLAVQLVWVPESVSETRRPIAHASDRRRRRAGAALIAVGVVLALAALVTRTAAWLAFIPLLIAWAGVAYAGGGRSGFYEVNEDGGLGEYLGRHRPEVGGMPPSKPG